MTKMIFVRHGQSVANLERAFAGHVDTVLTELGKQQAERTALFLKDYPIDKIYASDLTRAMQTAVPTAKMHGLGIVPDEALREIYAGAWEALPYETLMRDFSESYTTWRTDCGRAHPDGGESVVALSERIYREVDRIAAENEGKCVAVFSHATPIRLLRARWEGYAPEELARVAFCANASVSVVDYMEDGSYRVHLCGYDAHQGEYSTGLAKGIV
ncbi:MAG: histidine phosphatase family protein [Ruminococcaceae bacterium]|nr:histidine phosphatase family protein [Oscillospiraceae bacterium]